MIRRRDGACWLLGDLRRSWGSTRFSPAIILPGNQKFGCTWPPLRVAPSASVSVLWLPACSTDLRYSLPAWLLILITSATGGSCLVLGSDGTPRSSAGAPTSSSA